MPQITGALKVGWRKLGGWGPLGTRAASSLPLVSVLNMGNQENFSMALSAPLPPIPLHRTKRHSPRKLMPEALKASCVCPPARGCRAE